MKLGPSFLFPNGQIGTFGSITQIKSMLRDHRELFDVAVAGPLAGGAASMAVFMIGLLMTTGAQEAGSTADLIPIPAQLLQGSLGLSSITTLFLGSIPEGQQVTRPRPLFVNLGDRLWLGLEPSLGLTLNRIHQ